MLWELVLGFYSAAIIAVIAWWRNALDMGGAAAAIVAGTIIFGLGGWGPSIALVLFFVSGSILSALPKPQASLLPTEAHGRTWKQVVANGLIPALMILAAQLVPNKQSIFILAYYGAIAASCSDSWGTEIGTRFGRSVRDSLTGKPLSKGLSGGMSVAGTAASVVGSAIIVLAALLPARNTPSLPPATAMMGIWVAGILGSLSDSILGSSLQGKYRSLASGQIFEHFSVKDQKDGQIELIAGCEKITNNVVNFFSSALGALFLFVILEF